MYHYVNNCVGTSQKDVPTLIKMIDDAIDITRRTFLQYVDREEMAEIEQGLGYAKHPSQGLTMAGDYHVSYHRSKWNGKRCYFFTWSCIEYYFL